MAVLVEFLCAECGLLVCRAVRELPDLTELSDEMGEPHLAAGTFARRPATQYDRGRGGTGDVLIVNLEDLRNTRHAGSARVLAGCCGLDGCSGPNTVCADGHVLGTERSDCWMAHYLYFEPGSVTERVVAPAV
jgi:hypothetical protein